MARKIDPAVETILKRYDMNAKDVLWDCHGTWCMYHRALEQVAAKAGIKFAPPAIIENDGSNKCVAICVTGAMGERSEWSIGEAAPWNNKNAYPWAMAEKRAKDRVVLKLIGLHGLVYSEEEMNEAPVPQVAPKEPMPKAAQEIIAKIRWFDDEGSLNQWLRDFNLAGGLELLDEADYVKVRDAVQTKRETLKAKEAA